MSETKEYKPINARLHDEGWMSYVKSTGILDFLDENQGFYNGDQWPDHAPDGFPRPVMNICSYSANLKSSKICGTPLYFAITSSKEEIDCSALRRFDEYMRSKMNYKSFDYQSCVNGFVNGLEIVYWRWDIDNETIQGIFKGGLAEEHIDPHCFAVANPYLDDIQKQKWVMFWHDVEIGAVMDMIKSEAFSKESQDEKLKTLARESFGDHEDDQKKDIEYINHGLVRVYTRFFRVKGEVFFDCSTDKVDIFNTPHPLSTVVGMAVVKKLKKDYEDAEKNNEVDKDGNLVKDMAIDYEDVLIGDSPSTEQSDLGHKELKEKFSLYPFEVFRPYPINNSFFGRSDIHSIIKIQKAVNFCLAMLIQCSQNNAFNKIIVKEGALQGQKVTNEPGQVLTDHSQYTNGWGIKFAESQPMPNDLINFVGTLITFTAKYGGFDSLALDKIATNGVSGYAVQQALKENNTPIEQQQQLFWDFQVRCFNIRLMFYKFYIDKANYTFDLTDGEVEEQEQARNMLLAGANQGLPDMTTGKPFTPEARALLLKPTHKTQVRSFTKEDIWGTDFDIRVDAEQGLADTKLSEQQFWDNLILNGGINNLTPDMLDLYIQGAPSSSVPPQSKSELRRLISNLKHSEASQLRNELQQATSSIQQLAQYTKSLEAKLGLSQTYTDNLTKEFSDKINTANKVIQYQQQALATSQRNQVSPGEAKSNNARGVDGSKMMQETPVNQIAQ